MKIEEQVVSLELAKQLKELGVKQDSWLYWHITKRDGVQLTNSFIFRPCFTWHKYIETEGRCVTGSSIAVYSAYTTAEMCSMLPATLECTNDPYEPCEGIYVRIGREEDGTWKCTDGDYDTESKRIADATAKMIVYLLSEDCHYNDRKFLEWKTKLLEKYEPYYD